MLALEQNVSLKKYHTMAFSAEARVMATLTQEHDWGNLPRLCAAYERVIWLGGGSNTVFMADWAGLVVHIATRGITVTENKQDSDTVFVRAAAGENWHDFIRYCLKRGWYGLENLSFIPGTVGAAPVQNIGAYGAEVKDYIVQVDVLDVKSGTSFSLNTAACDFAYRSSIFKTAPAQNWVITHVVFRLSKTFRPNLSYTGLNKAVQRSWGIIGYEGGKLTPAVKLKNLVATIGAMRRQKLPDVNSTPNSGSFFHNVLLDSTAADQLRQKYPQLIYFAAAPSQVKIAAAQLLDILGLKGLRIGSMAVYEPQPLVLINQGGGTPEQLTVLLTMIKHAVASEFGLQLQVEPRLIA